jgi:predicted acetyltransferase
VVHTQDEHFYYLFEDPRNGTDIVMPHVYHETNTSGVGLMYRVNDVPLLFQQLGDHNFGHVTTKLKLTIKDSFYPKNNGSTWLTFDDGLATVTQEEPHDVAITLDVSDFSSLITGSISFERLYYYGLVELSDPEYLSTVNQLFYTPKKPFCRTGF